MFALILLSVVLGIVTFLLGKGGKLELLSFAVNLLTLVFFDVSAEITEHDSVISVIDPSVCFVRSMTSVESACAVISVSWASIGSGSLCVVCAVSPEHSMFLYGGSLLSMFWPISKFVIQLRISFLSSVSVSSSLRAIFSKIKLAAEFTAWAVNATISSRVTYLACVSVFCLFSRAFWLDGTGLCCGFAGVGFAGVGSLLVCVSLNCFS